MKRGLARPIGLLLTLPALTVAVPAQDTAWRPAAGAAGGALLPPAFLENRGQWADPVRYGARIGPLQVALEAGALQLDTLRPGADGAQGQRTRLVFEDAREDVELLGEEALPGRYHFLRERGSHSTVGFASVLYRGLYDGVDLRVRVEGERPCYDLLLQPGADLARVRVRCEGAQPEEDGAGGLRLCTALGVQLQSPPTTWEVLPDGARRALQCRAVLLDGTTFGFLAAGRDPGLPLVVDPSLGWSTHLGGSAREDLVDVELDPGGRPVVAGRTHSFDFPATLGSLAGLDDAVVAVLDPTVAGAGQLVWAAFIGGTREDLIMDLEVSSSGAIFAAGMTHSKDFPTAGSPYQSAYGGGLWDGFLLELSSDGSTLVYSSYLGGGSFDYAMEIELTEPRVLTVAGITKSAGFPVTANAFDPTKPGGRDYFFGRLDLDSPGTEYLSFIGTTGDEGFELDDGSAYGNAVIGLGVGPGGEIYLAGITNTLQYPTTANAWKTFPNGLEIVLTVVDPTIAGAAGLLYGTYFGGNAADGVTSMVVDDQGRAVMGGYSYSDQFPTTPGAFEETFFGPPGRNDATLTVFDPTQANPADQLVYATYLGGEGWESVMGLAATGDGAYVGSGFSGDGAILANSFPTTCDPTFVAKQDAFVFVLSPDANGRSDLHFSAMRGGSEFESFHGAAVASADPLVAYVAGTTSSQDFPTSVGAFQPTYNGGGWDGVVGGGWLDRRFCVGNPNSVNPDGAHLCGLGSTSVADNAFVLQATGAVPGQAGLFIYGENAGKIPVGNGYLCIASPQYRLNPAVPVDGTGTATRALDFTNLPVGGDIVGGSSWRFQFWYRDPPGGGAGYNFSSGLQVTFEN